MREIIRRATQGIDILEVVDDVKIPFHIFSDYIVRLYAATMEAKSMKQLEELAVTVDADKSLYSNVMDIRGEELYHIHVIGGYEDKKLLALNTIMTIFKDMCLQYIMKIMKGMNSRFATMHEDINTYTRTAIKLLSENHINTLNPISEIGSLLSINPNETNLLLEVYSVITRELYQGKNPLGGAGYIVSILPCYIKSMDILMTGIFSKDKAEQEYLRSIYESAISSCAENASSQVGTGNMYTKDMLETIIYAQNVFSDINKLTRVSAEYAKCVIDHTRSFYNSEMAKYGNDEAAVLTLEDMKEIHSKIVLFKPLFTHTILAIEVYDIIKNVHYVMLKLIEDTSILRLRRSK